MPPPVPDSFPHHDHSRRGFPPFLHGERAVLEGNIFPAQAVPAEQLREHARRRTGQTSPLLVRAIHENVHLATVACVEEENGGDGGGRVGERGEEGLLI